MYTVFFLFDSYQNKLAINLQLMTVARPVKLVLGCYVIRYWLMFFQQLSVIKMTAYLIRMHFAYSELYYSKVHVFIIQNRVNSFTISCWYFSAVLAPSVKKQWSVAFNRKCLLQFCLELLRVMQESIVILLFINLRIHVFQKVVTQAFEIYLHIYNFYQYSIYNLLCT